MAWAPWKDASRGESSHRHLSRVVGMEACGEGLGESNSELHVERPARRQECEATVSLHCPDRCEGLRAPDQGGASRCCGLSEIPSPSLPSPQAPVSSCGARPAGRQRAEATGPGHLAEVGHVTVPPASQALALWSHPVLCHTG